MITIFIILLYIATIFLGRYLDLQVSIHRNQIHYKKYITRWSWFIPIANILYPSLLYIVHEIDTRMMDVKHNKFINWFFIGINYKANLDKRFEKEFNDYINTKDEIERDLTMPKK